MKELSPFIMAETKRKIKSGRKYKNNGISRNATEQLVNFYSITFQEVCDFQDSFIPGPALKDQHITKSH